MVSIHARQTAIVKFLREHPDGWFPYAEDREGVEIACALHNLRIAEVRGNQYRLRSPENADRLLNDRGVPGY